MSKWRDSASVIIMTALKKNFFHREMSNKYTYKVLLLKRSKNASFMPEKYVFPGGTVESSDKDPKWKDFFESRGFNESHFRRLIPESDKERPLIFRRDSDNPNELAKEISLRITAIRETFEESGILLCKPSDDRMYSWRATTYNFKKLDLLKEWQEKVQQDSGEFYNLCEYLNYVPNLWSLFEWSNWLTPTTVIGGKRFNTIFFGTFFGTIPSVNIDPKEIESSVCEYPDVLLNNIETFSFAPPQFYDLNDIADEKLLPNLILSANERQNRGVYLKFPIVINVRDISVYLLPGDKDYPKNVSLTKPHTIDVNAESARSISKESDHAIHRLKIHNGPSRDIELIRTKDVDELSIETDFCE